MPIIVQCPNPACRQSCSVAESLSGQPVRCAKCGKAFAVKPTFDGQTSDTNKPQPTSNTNPFPVLPAEFGRYRVLKLLGKGGMGAVYLAEDSQLGRQVALKIPFFDALESPQRAERFVREARSAAALHHANICTVFDAGHIDGRPFLTMAYISGTPLEDEIDPDAPMPQVRAAEIARKIALALEHAHRKGVVHRDLKSANVMMDDSEPVVMDFGLAKRFGDLGPDATKLTHAGTLLGTPSYMSPEQVRGKVEDIGPATDVYSLGVVLFEMLTGHTPYRGAFRVILGQILAAPVPPVQEFRPDVDARLDAICTKAMAKDPSARFASMAEFANALGQYLKAPKSSPPSLPIRQVSSPGVDRSPFGDLVETPAPTPAAKKAKRGRAVAVALALALMVPLVAWLAVVMLRVETPNGTLVVEMNDADVEARIKNGKLILSGSDGKVRYTLTPKDRSKKLEAGAYKIRVEGADGLVLDTPEFTLKKGGQVKVRVKLERNAVAKKDAANLNPDRQTADDKGFVSLFNGKDLTGWKTHPQDKATWEVRDGILIGRGQLGQLFSERGDYENFHFRLEAMINDRGNSGQYFRTEFAPGFPKGYEAQINSTARDPVKTGSLYNIVNVTEQLHKPDEWFTQEVIAEGDHIVIKVNGKTVVDTHDSRYKKGHFALQQHDPATVVKFRNIEVKELPPKPESQGFVPLFNGKDLTGWKLPSGDDKSRWKIEDGLLVGSGPRGYLYSERADYSDFDLRAEVMIGSGENGGVWVRSPSGRSKHSGYEIDINDPSRGGGKETGSILVYPVDGKSHAGMLVDNVIHRANEWFTLAVRVRSNRIIVKVNDKEVADYLDASKHFTSGSIALQHFVEGKEIKFRKIEVKSLEEKVSLDPDHKAAEYVLSIGGTAHVSSVARDIKAVADLPRASFQLTSFELNSNQQVDDVGLAHFNGCKHLKYLSLVRTRVTDAGLAHFKDCKNLTDIWAWGTRVGDAGLAHFKDCKNLTALSLSETKVTDGGLAHFKDCKDLMHLWLNETQVSDAGMVYFKDCKNLKYLGLRGTRVGDAGLAHFKDCKDLTIIWLGGTRVSDVGLVYLRDCKKLTGLDVGRIPKVTAKGVEELKMALPKCKITRDGVK